MNRSSSQNANIHYLGKSRTLESISEALVTIDKEWRYIYINSAAEHLLGKPRAQILNRRIWDVFPDVAGSQIETVLCNVMSAGKPFEFESYNGLRDKWYANKVLPNPDGSVSIYFSDITEHKRLEEVRTRLAAIVESSDDAIVTKDLNGIITSWNGGAERIFGYKEKEVIGRPITILIPPERLNEEPGILERLRRGEKIDHYETIRQRKDGSLLNISLTVSPLMDATGKVIGASKIARDITSRKQAEERMRLLWEAAAIMLSINDPDTMVRELFTKWHAPALVDTQLSC